jgi:hypothetical protein
MATGVVNPGTSERKNSFALKEYAAAIHKQNRDRQTRNLVTEDYKVDQFNSLLEMIKK